MNISREVRDMVEMRICAETSQNLIDLIPKDDKQRKSRMERLQKKSSILDWEHVVKRIADYVC